MPNPNPKPPKRRKSSVHSRHAKGGKNKKTSYDYEAAREAIGVPNANSQTIYAASLARGPNPPNERSPLKSEYKAMLKQKEEEIQNLLVEKKIEADAKDEEFQNLLDEQKMAADEKDDKIQNLIESKSLISDTNEDLRRELNLKDSKIASQKEKINELASLLQSEKKKSRAAIAKLMNDADSVIAEAHSIKAESEEKIAAMGATLDHTQDRQKEVLKNERQLYSTQIATLKLKHSKQLQKVESEYETALLIDKQKYQANIQKYKDRLDDSLQKVADEKAKWQKKLQHATSELEKAKDKVYGGIRFVATGAIVFFLLVTCRTNTIPFIVRER